ncbi:MAG: hypothetical protein DCC54_14235, partial [Anaerolineae bacterium]
GEVLLADVLWKQRALDVWVQVALIFSGVMGVLGLLSERTIKIKEEQILQMAETEKPIAIQMEEEMRV